jgi:hypothetical protein
MKSKLPPIQKEAALLKSIEELRRTHDEISDLYQRIRMRVLTYIGFGFALLTLLYGDGGNQPEDKAEIFNRLFIPSELYGIILYFLGLFLIIVAICILFLATQSVLWRIPTDFKELKELKYQNFLEFLEYIRDEYIEALKINKAHCEKKQRYLDTATFPLIFGAVLLIVINYFS